MTAELRQAVIDAVHSVAPEADFSSLPADAPMREQFDLDSFDFLNVLVDLHARTGIDIPERDYGRVGTLSSLLAYLEQHATKPQA